MTGITQDPLAAHRMLDLANGMRPAPIRCNVTVASTLGEGTPLRESDGDEDFRVKPPIIATRHRVNTVEDAIRLQLINRALADRFAKYTPSSRRLAMLDQHTFCDGTGAKCAYISGLVTGFSTSANGRLSRICLLSPTVNQNVGGIPVRAFDSHIWLMSGDMDACGDYGDVESDDPVGHNRMPDHSGELHIGDTLCIAARLRAYTDKHGRRRLGVGEWTPLIAACLYLLRRRDGDLALKHVPTHLMRQMRVLNIEADGTPHWADPTDLTEEIGRWEAEFPAASSQLRLYKRI